MDAGILIGIVFGVLALWGALLVVFWLLRPKGVPVRELVRLVPDLVRMLRTIGGDRTTPTDVRLVLVGLLAWIVSPVDLIPEFIPVLGPMDDVVVAIVALRYVRRRIGVAGMRDRWPGTDDGFALLRDGSTVRARRAPCAMHHAGQPFDFTTAILPGLHSDTSSGGRMTSVCRSRYTCSRIPSRGLQRWVSSSEREGTQDWSLHCG